MGAGGPDYILLFCHFASQQVLAIVVSLVSEKGAVSVHFRDSFGAQIRMAFGIKRIVFGCEHSLGLSFSDIEASFSVYNTG